MSYCQAILKLDDNDPNVSYHNTQYGFPIDDDNELFGRLILEINQAGLSWSTILKKAENFRKAYSNFHIREVAAYQERDIQRLLSDPSIIRNKLKINAAIYNANKIMELQKEYGSFSSWLDMNIEFSKAQWVKLFKQHFKFTGGEITNEFLMSTSYLPGAHEESCPIYKEIIEHSPRWKQT